MASENYTDDNGTTFEVEVYYATDTVDTNDWEKIGYLLTSGTEYYEDPGELIEKIKWKDRTFNKHKPFREMNVRRDTKGKSGRL